MHASALSWFVTLKLHTLATHTHTRMHTFTAAPTTTCRSSIKTTSSKWCRTQLYHACLEAQHWNGSRLKQSRGAAFQTQSTSRHDSCYSFYRRVEAEPSHSLQLRLPSSMLPCRCICCLRDVRRNCILGTYGTKKNEYRHVFRILVSTWYRSSDSRDIPNRDYIKPALLVLFLK